MRGRIFVLWVGLAMHSMLGCGDDEKTATADGAAPTIADLALTPLEVEVGKVNNLSGSLSINDPDGDVTQIGMEVTLPDGNKQSLPKTQAQGTAGVKEGQVALVLAFGPPAAGSYALDVFVVDGKGRESNRLSTTLTAK